MSRPHPVVGEDDNHRVLVSSAEDFPQLLVHSLEVPYYGTAQIGSIAPLPPRMSGIEVVPELMQNAVAWSTEDLDLLTIRARGTTARLLKPLTERTQSFWEMANYAVALLALGMIAVVWNVHRKSEQPMELLPPEAVSTLGSEVK